MSRRGQNLTLLALTMLLVTLMVLVTLGIAQRIRENHELNNLADAAAYSSAVVNARAFNDIAIINRLQVSYWVSMAANESLISWTSYARALWNASYRNLEQVRDSISPLVVPPAPCGVVRRDAAGAANRIRTDFFAGMTGWVAADIAAGKETRLIQSRIATLRAETRGDPADGVSFPSGMRERLFKERKDQVIARRIVTESGLSGVSVVPTVGAAWPAGGAAGVSSRETGDYGLGLFVDCDDTQSGLCNGASPGNWSLSVLYAAMGTRGNPFTTSRGVVPPLVTAEWLAVDGAFPASIKFIGGIPTGSGYWSATRSHSTQPDNVFAWGDDHGSLTTTVSYNGCTRTETQAAWAYVKTTDLLDTADQHDWWPDDIGANGDAPGIPEQFHTVGDCTPLCPSVWVRQVHFHPSLNKPEDAYGQPKSQVMLVRDTSQTDAKSQPWKLDFKFGFGSVGSRFDNRGETLHASSLGGVLAIASQSAVATAMTYYHRKDMWLEHPNLLNPFWRATLVAADIDESSRADVDGVLSRPSEQWQGGAYDALVSSGFRGLH